METSESTVNQQIYNDSTHNELRGVFHGAITFVTGGPRKRTEILEWISTVPYTNHHQRISDDRLAGTGEWILKKEKYCTWRVSPDSMLLLLRGIPGAGKTYIASQVIDWFLSNATAESNLAYFYCNRAEESRRDPESILRTLIQQLAQTPSEDNLLTPVLDIYKEREKKGQLSARLTLKECRDLLVQLIAVYPQTMICLDALDEVDHKLRFELLQALRYVVERSNSLVKIFATTRMDTDILVQFEMFPRMELEPDDNIDDINRFVKEKVQETIERKRLLHGNVSNTLKDEICKVLCERSKGMFQLAALQITLLYDMVHPDDVRDSLEVLPETLTDAYGEIYNRIRNQSRRASQLALNAFRWIQCSYEPLRSETLLDAVTAEIDGSGEFSHNCTAIQATDLLKACQNLLILDERLNVFRFAHLSVEEYLDTQLPKIDSHTEIAKICLSLVCSSRSWTDYNMALTTVEGRYNDRHLLLYSAVFWPWHLNHCRDTCQRLEALWENFVSEATFQRWIAYHRQRVRIWFPNDSFWCRSQALHREGKDRFSTVCVFGLGRKLTSISKSQYGWTARIKLKLPTAFICETVRRDRIDRLLLCASKFGDLEICLHLLDAGVCVSAVRDGWTPLHAAAGNGHEAVVLLLLDRGADVSVADDDGGTPLHTAARNGHMALTELLLDRGADVSAVAGYGSTPLHVAAGNGHGEVAQLLLDRGADVSAVAGGGWTPLHVAAGNGHEEVAILLLDRGAGVSVARNDGRTPLHTAAQSGHEALALLLLDRGADVSAVNSNGWMPLHVAVGCGCEALAQLLVDRGADISAATSIGLTPLHVAVQNGHEALARLLVNRGANISAANADGSTPLHFAAENGQEALAWLLIEQGADVSAVDRYRSTPLHFAVQNSHLALVWLLVGQGANISAAKVDGSTPLHIAARNGDHMIAWELVDRGADTSAADCEGLTPLRVAEENGHEALARLLAAATA